MGGVWGTPRVQDADVGVCRPLGRWEYFLILSPWMGPGCFFLCLCLQGFRWPSWVGRGAHELGPTKEVASPRYKDRAQDATSSGVEAPLMMGRASSANLMTGPGSPSYQGFGPPSCGLKPTLMTGRNAFSGALPRG